MTLLAQQARDMRKQFEATPWLRWGAAGIAVLAMAFVWQFLSDARASSQRQAIDQESKLGQVRALQGQDIWLVRENEAKQLIETLEAQLPTVKTPGLAQASLQSWLRTVTERFTPEQGIRISIEKASEIDALPNVVGVRATLSGNLTPRDVLTLIRTIESSPNLAVIETLNITNDVSKTVNMSLNAYFRIDDGAAVQ